MDRRLLSLAAGLIFLGACADQGGEQPPAPSGGLAAAVSGTEAETGSYGNFLVPPSSIRAASVLKPVAIAAANESIRQSSAIFGVEAAASELRASGAARLPQLRPTASVDGEGETQFALSLRQPIWDFGRSSSEREAAEVALALARVKLWIEQNDAVYDALSAALDYQHAKQSQAELNRLLARLVEIELSITTRTSSGVAGRGEMIDINIARREVERRLIEFEARSFDATSTLRLSAGEAAIAALGRGQISLSDCRIPEGTGAAPSIMQAQFEVRAADNKLAAVQARRFPSIVGSLGVNDEGATSTLLSIDASDLLVWDRTARTEAAQQSAEGARRILQNEARNILRDTDRLRADAINKRSVLAKLNDLADDAASNDDVFDELFPSGVVSLTEAVRLAEEVANTRLAVLDLETEIVRICLRAAQLNGALAERWDE